MTSRGIEISVGLFMLAGCLALAMLAFRVSGLSLDSGGKHYTLYASFENASGLNVRSRVTLAGVLVGRVTAIELDPVDMRARATLEIDADVDYLSVDTIAAIKTAGVLGEKYISLSVGGDPELLGDGDVIEDTQSTLVLEDLIGRFLTSSARSSD